MEDRQDLFSLQIDHQGREEFVEVSRWSKLMGIVVLCMLGIGFFIMVFAWRKLGFAIALSSPGDADRLLGFAAVMFGLVGVVIGTMIFFLIRGANRIRMAVRTQDRGLLNRGLGDVRSYFAIFGVISLLALFFNLLSFI